MDTHVTESAERAQDPDATAPASNARMRRAKNWFEPIYSPQDHVFPEHNWDFAHTTGPARSIFTSENLDIAIGRGIRSPFKNITFSKCDFSGVFKQRVVFKECNFDNCDFGLSTWEEAKFSGCQFENCSFSQSTWNNCELSECNWEKIAISGNEFKLNGTVISNPDQFISAACTLIDKNRLNGFIKRFYQRMRLARTKATVSRAILGVLLINGNERSYYKAVRSTSNQSVIAELYESLYNLLAGPFRKRIFGALSYAFRVNRQAPNT